MMDKMGPLKARDRVEAKAASTAASGQLRPCVPRELHRRGEEIVDEDGWFLRARIEREAI